jgi:purine nucleosidase
VTRLIVDCDPGVDDAIALLLAFASPELDLLGITTVAGNVDAARTAANALALRSFAGREEVPVFRGCGRPLVREAVEAGDFHGAGGLGDSLLPPGTRLDPRHAVSFLIEALTAAAPQSVTLAMLGPMTNLAAALAMEPAIIQGIAQLVIMGGARSEGGNITASAEYNIYADPHAARAVLSSGIPAILFGLDATHGVRATPERTARLSAKPSKIAKFTAELLGFMNRIPENGGEAAGAPLHDPCPVASLLNAALFETKPAHVTIVTEGPASGHSSVEFRGAEGSPLRWCTRADADGIFALMEARLG